jgi:rubrerythrin
VRRFLRDWILRRVVRSALVFERDAADTYRLLAEKAVDTPLWEGIDHLLKEEELHHRMLLDAAEGRLVLEALEEILRAHPFAAFGRLAALTPDLLAVWGDDLRGALKKEEETFVFYSNLRRMSRIPAVKRAFEVLAEMEREHLTILRALLRG